MTVAPRCAALNQSEFSLTFALEPAALHRKGDSTNSPKDPTLHVAYRDADTQYTHYIHYGYSAQFLRDNHSSDSGTFCSCLKVWPKRVNGYPNLDFTRSPVSSLGIWLTTCKAVWSPDLGHS